MRYHNLKLIAQVRVVGGGGAVRVSDIKYNNIYQFILCMYLALRICGGCITKAFIMISRVHKVKRMNRVRVTSVLFIYFVNLSLGLDCYIT